MGGFLGIAIQIKFVLPLLKALGVVASVYGLADALANEDYDLALFRGIAFYAPAVLFAGIRIARLGMLRFQAPNRWVSQSTGLIYGSAPEGNRVLHVMTHMTDNTRKSLHGIFTVRRSEVLSLIDEAYLMIQQNPAKYYAGTRGDNVSYLVPMRNFIGVQGGANGSGRELGWLRLVLKNGNEVITAFPDAPQIH